MHRDPLPLFDTRHVRRAFSRAAGSYGAAADLQHQVEARLLESLDYYEDRHKTPPGVVVDLGSGPGSAAHAMRRRWPRARVVAVDLALPMLREARRHAPAWRPLRRDIDLVCADARALPLAEGSVDVLVSNLCVQWIDDLSGTFAGLRRALKPGGLLLLSTFGSQTLQELREAFAAADQSAPHVSPFADIAGFGDALMHAGFRDPVLDRDTLQQHHPDLRALMRQLRALGATNALAGRRRTLTGRARFAAAADAYEPLRTPDGLPATWEVIQAQAWAPPPGAPIREGGADVTRVPIGGIPVRRRPR